NWSALSVLYPSHTGVLHWPQVSDSRIVSAMASSRSTELQSSSRLGPPRSLVGGTPHSVAVLTPIREPLLGGEDRTSARQSGIHAALHDVAAGPGHQSVVLELDPLTLDKLAVQLPQKGLRDLFPVLGTPAVVDLVHTCLGHQQHAVELRVLILLALLIRHVGVALLEHLLDAPVDFGTRLGKLEDELQRGRLHTGAQLLDLLVSGFHLLLGRGRGRTKGSEPAVRFTPGFGRLLGQLLDPLFQLGDAPGRGSIEVHRSGEAGEVPAVFDEGVEIEGRCADRILDLFDLPFRKNVLLVHGLLLLPCLPVSFERACADDTGSPHTPSLYEGASPYETE